MKIKATLNTDAKPAKTWRVIFPSGSVIDFPNSEVRKGSGSVLILTRNDEEIAVFQTWAGYHMIEGAP